MDLLNVLMIVSMALEEKYMAKNKPIDTNSAPGLKKSSAMDLMILYVELSGVICLANNNTSLYNFADPGILESTVKRNIASGGMASKKLNAMAAALSLIPTCRICELKNKTTSYKGSP